MVDNSRAPTCDFVTDIAGVFPGASFCELALILGFRRGGGRAAAAAFLSCYIYRSSELNCYHPALAFFQILEETQ